MCELMGLCLNRPAAAHFSIREFGSRDCQNMDGWGLAWYSDRSAAIIKEPVSWRASKHTNFLEEYHALRSAIYIAHVRHRTVGGQPTHADTHPFVRELRGREYVFAHNGTIQEHERFPLGRYQPVGATDSEYAFCYLMGQLARRRSDLTTERDYRWLHRELAALNAYGQVNCLLSDGQSLFAYHDAAAYKGLVWSRISVERSHAQNLEDSDLQLSLDGTQTYGVIVATHPLDETQWQAFKAGELLVLRNGAVHYSSHLQPRRDGLAV